MAGVERAGRIGRGWLSILCLMVGAAGPAGRAVGDELADVLAARKGQVLDLVELGTGRRFVRPTLESVVEKDGRVVSLRIRPEDQRQTISLTMVAITKIVAGRETVHESEARGKTATQIRGKRSKERNAAQVAESRERMRKNGIDPWPNLTAEQHATAVTELEAFVEQVRTKFPNLVLSRTHEFLVATDIPAAQMAPFVAGLDRMHDLLCDLYAIPRGEPVWQGKCLVVAFLSADDFRAFEEGFMQSRLRGMHGICHQRSDGRVITACHRGDDGPTFAHMLVHETSHGFNHRWMSPARLPNWLNEGIAEWVGARVVPGCDQVPLKEAQAAEFMRSRRDVGPGFFEADNIAPVQYGIASALVRFMVARDSGKFAAFVKGIKEGMTPEAALRESFDASLEDLLAAYGHTIGVPDLHR